MGAIQLSPRTCIATGAALSTGLSHPDTLDASTGILHPSMVGYSADWIPHVFITGTRRANFGFGFGFGFDLGIHHGRWSKTSRW